jgi:hypothetical protein
MTHPTTNPQRKRLVALSLLVCCALLAGAGQAPVAAAENVPNPAPELIARWEPCEVNTGVTVIVDDQKLGPGMIYVGCALGEQADGVEALQNAGFQLEGTADYGLAFVCRIDGEPTPAETPCITTPGGDAYWSYWRGKPGGAWGFSGAGAKSPQSRSPINSVEGWSFGGGHAPRIQPMDGSGPSVFTLPPRQESSVIPVALAREWLARTLDETAEQAEKLESEKIAERPEAEELLPGAIALERAGMEPAGLRQVADWLARSCEEKHESVEGCPLRELANPKERDAGRYALAVLGLHALGQNPESFAGRHLRAELEEMLNKSSGEVKGSKAIEVTAPTVLALARTGELPKPAVKTVALILSEQNAATGSWEATTSVTAEAIEALVAAREQGASVLGGEGLLEEIKLALTRAGDYLAGVQEPGGGLPETSGGEAASFESTALGAVGLALAGLEEQAELAAKWVSRYQVTAEYAGGGDPETGEHTPAEDVIGAFLPSEAKLRAALLEGVGSDRRHGSYVDARAPTANALLALASAGPYGPYDATFAQQSLLFETRAVGSPSRPLAATLTNHDVRPLTVSTASIVDDDAADFSVDGCAGETLAPGESCELSASFDPTTSGLREALLQVAFAGTSQTVELPLSGTGAPEAEHEETSNHEEQSPGPASTSSLTASQEVLGSRSVSPPRIQTPRLDGLGASRGLVGVSWSILEDGAGLNSWTIASQTVGAANAQYVTRASGSASVTSALLKLPAGVAYELRITVTDILGVSSTTQIGKALVPYDDRWSGLHYRGRWRRLEQAGAWLGTVSHAPAGAAVAMTLHAGRPVFLLRATAAPAKVEVRAGSRRQVFVVASGHAGVSRQITAAARSAAGAVSLLVLNGTVDLDGVAVEG